MQVLPEAPHYTRNIMAIKIAGKNYTGVQKKSNDIVVGETFFGNIGGHEGLYLKGWSIIICLNDPSTTWTYDVTVYDYRPVDITLTVND